MAKRVLNYTVGDENYTHHKFKSVSVSDDYTVVNDPVDNNIPGLIHSVTDKDPLLFSYMNDDEPEVLVCNVDTPMLDPLPAIEGISNNALTSTGRYSVCIPEVTSDGSLTWKALPGNKGKDINLVLSDDPPVKVAGNPHGIVKCVVNNVSYLYIVDYDSTIIYRVALDVLKNADNGTDCEVEIAINLSEEENLFPLGTHQHGTALVALPDEDGNPQFFAVYTNTVEDIEGNVEEQDESTLIRLLVDEITGDLSVNQHIAVGPNTTGIHPFVDSDGNFRFLLPGIGGPQNISETNGVLSVLYVAMAFGDWGSRTVYQIINGDGGGGRG